MVVSRIKEKIDIDIHEKSGVYAPYERSRGVLALMLSLH